MQQKSQKADENQGGKQKTQWDSNSEGECRRGLVAILGSNILRTYLQQKGQGLLVMVVRKVELSLEQGVSA